MSSQQHFTRLNVPSRLSIASPAGGTYAEVDEVTGAPSANAHEKQQEGKNILKLP